MRHVLLNNCVKLKLRRMCGFSRVCLLPVLILQHHTSASNFDSTAYIYAKTTIPVTLYIYVDNQTNVAEDIDVTFLLLFQVHCREAVGVSVCVKQASQSVMTFSCMA